MDEEIPPHVILETSPPRPAAIPTASPSTDQALTDLSRRFDLHSIHPYRPNHCLDVAPPHSVKSHPSRTLRRTRSHEDLLHHVRQEKQFKSRCQCKTAHLSRIAAMVKEMLEGDTWRYPASNLPPSGQEHRAPPNPSTPELIPSSSSAAMNRSTPTFDYPAPSTCHPDDDDEKDPTELVIRRGAYKVARDAKYSPTEDPCKRPGVVKKKIKMRKRKPK